MYLEHFQLHSSPFSEKVNPGNFFPGAGRADICKALLRDIRKGEKFAFLVGGEGSGKTLLCQVLARRLGGSVEVIYVENPMGSFDDLLRLVCVDLGIGPDLDKEDMVSAFKAALEKRKAEGQHVVLIIDDAEKIFLAALERLLRLLCDVGQQGNFTLILAGRSALVANLEQLTVYCTGVDLAHGYELEPMDSGETRQYLLHRLVVAGLKEQQLQDVFADQAVDKIYQAARGNPRMTNILAEEALRTSSDEKSFMVLLEHVGGATEKRQEPSGKGRLSAATRKRKTLLLAAGACVLAIVVGFVFFSGRKTDRPISVTTPAIVNKMPPVSEKTARQIEPAARKNVEPSEQPRKDTSPYDRQGVEQTSPRTAPSAPLSSEVKTEVKEGKKAVSQHAGRDGRALFDKRVRASAAWLSGAYTGKYTIQLMMLTSESARKNVEKLLTKPSYFSILDKLYILQKKTTPPTLFLFYGTFPSMDAARQARNTMPIFLRKHHPYALSIADALTKTED